VCEAQGLCVSPLRAEVSPGSKHTLGGYHETHKGARFKPIGYLTQEWAEALKALHGYLHG